MHRLRWVWQAPHAPRPRRFTLTRASRCAPSLLEGEGITHHAPPRGRVRLLRMRASGPRRGCIGSVGCGRLRTRHAPPVRPHPSLPPSRGKESNNPAPHLPSRLCKGLLEGGRITHHAPPRGRVRLLRMRASAPRVRIPASAGTTGLRARGYEVPASAGTTGLRAQGYEVPASAGTTGLRARGYEVPASAGTTGLRAQGYEVPASAGMTGLRAPGVAGANGRGTG